MAPLPPLESRTVAEIFAARERDHKEFDSQGLPISELGSDCDRAIWYAFRHASEPEPKTGKKLRRFETGNIEEQRLLDDLRCIEGVQVVDIDPETGKQWKIYLLGGHVRGKLDGEAYGLPEAPKTWHVVECKAHNEKSFKEVLKKGLEAAKPSHHRQCLLYMYARGKDRCLYIFTNTNTDDIESIRLHYDHGAAEQLISRLERIIRSSRAPSRISEDPTKWPCILCRHKDVCFAEAFGRSNCRTCVHSTPCIDKGETSARWHCERFGRDLTFDEQKAGCPAHVFLPDMVPGTQVDAGDEWVSYTMQDGSTWRDGVPGRRYFYHPETESLFTIDDGSEPADPLVEELTAFEYGEAQRYQAQQADRANEQGDGA
jgi:hypothetical protein